MVADNDFFESFMRHQQVVWSCRDTGALFCIDFSGRIMCLCATNALFGASPMMKMFAFVVKEGKSMVAA